MWLACYTQEAIAEAVGVDVMIVNRFLQEHRQKFQENDSLNFRNFEPEIYSVWSFPALTNPCPCGRDWRFAY